MNERLDNQRDVSIILSRAQDGKVLCTTPNFLAILQDDNAFHTVRLNLLTGRPEILDNGKMRHWDDSDAAAARCYIESLYCIHSRQKYEDAFSTFIKGRGYHPIKDLIESVKWDGRSRIDAFLSTWMLCDHTPYTQEVSRLIFAGGIHRLYKPGCKFDDMPVLIGGQGAGKSTLVRWLALDDSYFREVKDFEGKEGVEILNGAWICEVGELLAMTKVREQEAVKSYLTRQVDTYRRPYDRYIVEQPRSCIFIGTTNKNLFLTDKTGGRRFYPVMCRQSGYTLHDKQEECKAYIRQCWAEALAKIDTDAMRPYADRRILTDVLNAQDAASEDDGRVGLISAYIKDKDAVCCFELWEQALGIENKLPEKRDTMDISLIMQSFDDWERVNSRRTFGKYGPQKYWRKKQQPVETPDECPF